jgi:hypothetical protein
MQLLSGIWCLYSSSLVRACVRKKFYNSLHVSLNVLLSIYFLVFLGWTVYFIERYFRLETPKFPENLHLKFKKASNHFKKASIPLKIYLKSLTILEKVSILLKILQKELKYLQTPCHQASVSLKRFSKSLIIFIKASYF